MQIKGLFDTSKDIYRTIEKVITYNVSQEALLKAEISEYIVTESIEEQFERVLTKMEAAMVAGGQNDMGVWVSGFYGSGKSSFTKYLGLALDDSIQLGGVRFLKHLQDRMNRPQSKALLSTVASKFPAAVVLLDLASEMLAGATMEDVSTVLYYKVLQWAGYSRNLKVAALERRLKQDGRFEELDARIQEELGVSWKDVHNDTLVTDSLVPEIAHEMYPALFKTPSAFSTETTEIVRFENERVKEMIDIVRETTGKQYIIFIVDEVGQYIAARPHLILNLDGLAKNLKYIGEGKVWMICTAQQTLTEDDPRAALNSPELYKLQARFPIQIDLESRDIKEICYRRLLGKSPQGEKTLNDLFDKHGPELRFNTSLQDAKFYDSDFKESDFIELYPFLPAHFDVLLHLLGALAKTTGGIGLRSAIKIIQDILIEGPENQQPVADRPVGWLATTVTLYDILEKDIRRAAPSIHKAVGKVVVAYPASPVHQEVAKTVAVLQILGNMPVTVQNVASLTHPAVSAASRGDEVAAAVESLKSDGMIPFGEKDGSLCFFSEKINDIDQERAQIPLRSIETRRIQNEALRDAYNPLPSARLNGTLSVGTGLKTASGSMLTSLAGERETIQTIVELAAPEDYETTRTRLVEESRQRSSQYAIYLLGRTQTEINELVAEIYRSREIAQRYHSDPDQELKEYCTAQIDRASKLSGDLQRLLRRSLAQGSFVFRGQVTAVESLHPDLLESAKKFLSDVAGQVFDRYREAPLRVETNLAEKFLRTGNLKAISSEIDPLGLVQIAGGTPRINGDHKALVSIRDFIDRQGTADGKHLTANFSDAPFGWSPDTLRYLVAALLVNGEIKLKVSGREVTVNGQQAIEALRTNNAFKPVGVSLREGRPPVEMLARAAQRLTELTGEQVIPLEDVISKATAKHFTQFQQRYGALENRLKTLGLPGEENARALNEDLTEILLTDASDAPQRLGGEESTLYDHLKWAAQADKALKGGLETTISELREHWKEIKDLPDTGAPGQLRLSAAEALQQVSDRLGQDNFFIHTADLQTALTSIKARVGEAARQMTDALRVSIEAAQEELSQLPEWQELTHEEQQSPLNQLDGLAITPSTDLRGLKDLVWQEFRLKSELDQLKRKIEELGRQRWLTRLKAEKEQVVREGKTRLERHIKLRSSVTSAEILNALIQELQDLASELSIYSDIEVTFQIEDGPDAL
jgi:hypothetical protein